MKVQGPGGPQGPSRTKGKDKASGTSGGFGDFVAPETQAASSPQATQSIARLDALLAVQGAEDPAARAAKKRMRHRASDILNELEKIRLAMLGGTLTVGHMIDVADVVASHREKIYDPGLTAIMDEVDLRAQVELAKMRIVLDARKNAAINEA
ncbi:MAG: flagellar assembly protein FliX [Alphaproteobacteria bacterium]|nr:flagellar assembly protein FliX [Alphaproteobacteria bacterium]